jgi:hypothetical protein
MRWLANFTKALALSFNPAHPFCAFVLSPLSAAGSKRVGRGEFVRLAESSCVFRVVAREQQDATFRVSVGRAREGERGKEA